MHRLDNLYALKFESLESASLLAVKMSDTNENFSAEVYADTEGPNSPYPQNRCLYGM
jgi:hypothetical protein